MVSLLAIGIQNSNREKIECAFKDAENIYKTFEIVLKREFKKYCSICVKDINELGLMNILSLIQNSLDENDIFVFYFSGHGTNEANGHLKLVLNDKEYSFSQIVTLLGQFSGKVVIILDCCYSATGICEINRDNVYCDKNISLIASNSAVESADFVNKGSIFTNNFCKAIMRLYHKNSTITLKNIIDEASLSYDKKCYIVIGGGDADVVLSNSKEDFTYDIDKILFKLKKSNYDIREMLWYSIDGLTDGTKYDLFQKLVKSKEYGYLLGDSSWRVRRALGSTFGSVYDIEVKKKIVEQLLESDNWTQRCVGYIASRKKIWEKVFIKMKDDIDNKNNPMDIVWLGALYLSQNLGGFEYEEKEIFNSNLTESIWGAIEIWKFFLKEINTREKLIIFKDNLDENIYQELCLHLFFTEEVIEIDFKQYNPLIQKYQKQFKQLYKAKKRGPTQVSSENKWIWSMIYGNWRDQVDLHKEMEDILNNLRTKEYEEFFQVVQYIPSVEIKMAIIDYFIMDNTLNQHGEYIKWAFEEEHPWIFRTALPLFKDNLVKEIKFNRYIYPGAFDVLIECKKIKTKVNIDFNYDDLTKLEAVALKTALENE